MAITRLSLDGYGARRAGSFAGRVEGFVFIPLSSLVIDLGDNLGKTLMPNGNTLPISITTATPSAAPPGNKGVVFKVSGGVLTVYAWDGTQWAAN